MSKTDRILEALMGGEELTAKQMKARFSVGNPAEVVRQLRFKGKTKNFYRLGTPSRAVVAAGYRALAQAA
jgi:hypothetical protein